jgi:anion-transporting  ArsA/GET3 family ATPase
MITIDNISKTELKTIPSRFKEDFVKITQAVKAKLHIKNKEVKNIIEHVLNEINIQIFADKKPTVIKLQTTKKVAQTPKSQKSDVVMYPINKIFTDEKRFQNREKLDQEKLDYIVKNFNPTIMDPVILWIDPKDKRTYV